MIKLQNSILITLVILLFSILQSCMSAPKHAHGCGCGLEEHVGR